MSGVRARFGEGQKRVSLGTMVDVAVGMMFVLKYSFLGRMVGSESMSGC